MTTKVQKFIKKSAQKIYKTVVMKQKPVMDIETHEIYYPVRHEIFGRVVGVSYRKKENDHYELGV